MDGVLKDGRIGRLWMCRRGEGAHALGLTQRVSQHGHFVNRLALFRHAVEAKRDAIIEADVIGLLDGTAYDIECELCGAKRTWQWDAAGFERLLENRAARNARAIMEMEHASAD